MQREPPGALTMIDRDKETVSRHSVLEPEQRSSAAPARFRQGRRKRRASRLIPLLIFALVAMLIARQEVPAVADWWEKTFAAQRWAVKQACREAALQAAPNRQFVRVIEHGVVHETDDGFYVEALVLGEMGADGAEQQVPYSCYLDSGYQLVKINRLDERAAVDIE